MLSIAFGRRWLVLAAWSSAMALSAGGVCAQEIGAASSDADLRDQVRQLTALVQSLAEKDQAEIKALQSQVKALQAKLDAQAAVPAAGQTASGSLASASPPPQTVSNVATTRVEQNETHHFALKSDDGRYSIGFAGIVQFDGGDFTDFKAASKIVGSQELSNGINARRARIGVSGTAAGGWSYAFIYDGGNSQDTTAKGIQTAQIIYGGFGGVALELGYSSTYFTLDQSTSAGDLMFTERATPSNIATNFNAGDFRSNAGVRFFSPWYWIGGYLTGPASGDSHTLTGERFGAFERAAFQIVHGPDYSLHLGFGVDELLRSPNAGNGTPNTLSLSDQPEVRIDPTTFLNTGTIGTAKNPVKGGYVLDLETAATWKGVYWQGEYYHYDVDRFQLSSNHFDGYYGQASYTLTGETHRYNPQAGAYYRILPTHAFSLKDGTWGAWEVGARYSYINLDSNFVTGQSLSGQTDAIEGGKQSAYTFALNWYPNDIVRLMFDYGHVDYSKANGAAVTGAPLGVPVGAKFDYLSLRTQVVF